MTYNELLEALLKMPLERRKDIVTVYVNGEYYGMKEMTVVPSGDDRLDDVHYIIE